VSQKIQYLSLEEVIEIGEALIPDFRIRDIGLLESAVHRPATVIYGQEAYPSIEGKIAAMMHSLAANHALIDGNKRLTWSSGRLFAILNNLDFYVGIDEAEGVIISLASGELDAKSLAPIIGKWLKG
jgi:death-on-curing protein